MSSTWKEIADKLAAALLALRQRGVLELDREDWSIAMLLSGALDAYEAKSRASR